MYILDEFDFNMLTCDTEVKIIRFRDYEQKFIPQYAEILVSRVKDKNLARLFSIVLDREVQVDDSPVTFELGEYSMYGLYKGPPLTGEETKMPEGGLIHWHLIIPEQLIWEHNALYGPVTKSVRY